MTDAAKNEAQAPAAFTSALAYPALTPLYDAAIALLTREKSWRSAVVDRVSLTGGERLLDVGCGTGSLIVRLASGAPRVEIHGIDPDADVLRRARKKAAAAGVRAEFHQGFLTDEFLTHHGGFDVVTSSLVFHQVPLDGKRALLSLMWRALNPAGRLLIADYSLQRTALMRALFGATVQALDGVADTQPNADGVLPALISESGFSEVREAQSFQTATGSISILSGIR